MAVCPRGHANPEHYRFCGECGVPLAAANPGAPTEVLGEPPPHATDATTELLGGQLAPVSPGPPAANLNAVPGNQGVVDRLGGSARVVLVALATLLVIGVVALVAFVIGHDSSGGVAASLTSTAASPTTASTTESHGAHTVSRNSVASQIASKMTDAAGNKPDSVSCPDDLEARVGAQLNCDMKIKNQTFNINVTVTSVDGDNVKFDMLETVDKNQVARIISDKLTQQVGRRPDSVSCPDNLKGDVGATLRCQLTDGRDKYGVNVTVIGVDAGDVHFDFKVDDQPEPPTAYIPPPGTVPPTPAHTQPVLPDADGQGFLNYPGARCNYTNPAVAIGRTSQSLVVICQTGVGRLYYKGFGLQNGLSVEIDDPVRNGANFIAANNGVQYSVSPNALIITRGSTVLSTEPMVEYWSG